jgi:hypothetical protein
VGSTYVAVSLSIDHSLIVLKKRKLTVTTPTLHQSCVLPINPAVMVAPQSIVDAIENPPTELNRDDSANKILTSFSQAVTRMFLVMNW